MPAIASGCSDCSSSARSPPTNIDASAWTRQMGVPGTNHRSPGASKSSAARSGALEPTTRERTWSANQSRIESLGICPSWHGRVGTLPGGDGGTSERRARSTRRCRWQHAERGGAVDPRGPRDPPPSRMGAAEHRAVLGRPTWSPSSSGTCGRSSAGSRSSSSSPCSSRSRSSRASTAWRVVAGVEVEPRRRSCSACSW